MIPPSSSPVPPMPLQRTPFAERPQPKGSGTFVSKSCPPGQMNHTPAPAPLSRAKATLFSARFVRAWLGAANVGGAVARVPSQGYCAGQVTAVDLIAGQTSLARPSMAVKLPTAANSASGAPTRCI